MCLLLLSAAMPSLHPHYEQQQTIWRTTARGPVVCLRPSVSRRGVSLSLCTVNSSCRCLTRGAVCRRDSSTGWGLCYLWSNSDTLSWNPCVSEALPLKGQYPRAAGLLALCSHEQLNSKAFPEHRANDTIVLSPCQIFIIQTILYQ